MNFLGIRIITSEAVAPGEVVVLGSENATRWTPDGGIEELSDNDKAYVKAFLDRLRDGLPPEERVFVLWEDAEDAAAYADFYDDSGCPEIHVPSDPRLKL